MGEIRAVLLDMDGVTFDTETLAVRFWKEAMEDLGLPADGEFLKAFPGLDIDGAAELFKKTVGTEEQYAAVRARRLELTKAYTEKYGVGIKEGLYDLLTFLKENGYKAALVTSTDAERVSRYVKMAGAEKHFDLIVTGDMAPKRKPAPDLYLLACERLGIPPGECLAAEDSPVGLQAAAAAGVPAVMIPDLLPPTAAERDIAEAVLGSLRDIPEFLKIRARRQMNG